MRASSTPSLLPEPDPAERDRSLRLVARLHDEIAAGDGAIGFDRYMAIALYEPGLGYYASDRRKFGPAGDFVTAPELTPLFGACVADQLAAWLPGIAPCLWEFGAGSGELAAQLLSELEALGFGSVQYRIFELSAALRARQQATIAARVPQALGRVRWLDALPDRFDGIVLANELLDALPVRLFELNQGRVLERVVTRASEAAPARAGLTPGAASPLGLALTSRAADPAFARSVEARLARAGWPAPLVATGYRSELGEQAAAWVASVSERLADGVLLLIDYGFPAAELYHPSRASGSLNCHYRHRSHAEPLWRPGLSDITAHVDFSAVHDAASRAGLSCLGYGSQAAFLLGCGLAQRFTERQSPSDAAGYAQAAQALQMLVSEAEMGELFKVIALSRGVDRAPLKLAGRDRRAALDADGSAACE